MSDSSTETVVHEARTPAAPAGRKAGLPWAAVTVLAAFALMGLRGWGIPLRVSVPVALVLVFFGALIGELRRRGPPALAWYDVAMDDPALSPEMRVEVERAAGDFQALGLELVGVARATLSGGASSVCTVGADDPRTGIRATANVAELGKGRPARLIVLGFTTWLEDGRLLTAWNRPLMPDGAGAVILPTTRSAAMLYRVHLYRHARANAAASGLAPAGTAAERAMGTEARLMEWFQTHGWVRPHADGSPRYTTRAAVLMMLFYLPPGRWLVYLRNRIAERALLARAGA